MRIIGPIKKWGCDWYSWNPVFYNSSASKMKIKTIVNRLVIFIVTSLQLFMLSLLISHIPFTVAVLVAYLFGFVNSNMNLWLLILGMATVIFAGIIIYYVIVEVRDKKQQKKTFEYLKSLNKGKETNNGTH